VRGVSLFSAVSTADMQTARIVTGATMAAFIGVGMVPGLRQHAGRIRGILLVVYLLACGIFVGYVLMR
jgi:hypothetical protein